MVGAKLMFFQLISQPVKLHLLKINRKIFTDHFVTARVDVLGKHSRLNSSLLRHFYASEKLWNRTPCPPRLVDEMFKARVRFDFLAY